MQPRHEADSRRPESIIDLPFVRGGSTLRQVRGSIKAPKEGFAAGSGCGKLLGMPVPTPFHPRTQKLCTSRFWKDWAGYHAVRSYDTTHDREYHAIRHAAALIDVTPLHKYDVTGSGAGECLGRILVKDVGALAVGRATYLCWCDDEGKVLDDGTVARLGDQRYRVTSNQPALGWLSRFATAHRVDVSDVSASVATLALQGPRSREVLRRIAGDDVAALRFFGVIRSSIAGVAVEISRTGYTGDLGYEIWMEERDALAVWDAVMEAGEPHRILPVGLDAMDVARVEAGFILNGVDYFSANRCLIEARKSTPYEIGLGWTVQLDRGPFQGQAALRAEKRRGPAWSLVGLELDWEEYEALFAEFGLPPQVPHGGWRDAVPVYDPRGRQVGQATSGAWSPILKKNLALASVRAPHGKVGTRLAMEVTAEFQRRTVTATVVKKPFFDPPRKRA